MKGGVGSGEGVGSGKNRGMGVGGEADRDQSVGVEGFGVGLQVVGVEGRVGSIVVDEELTTIKLRYMGKVGWGPKPRVPPSGRRRLRRY
jgi:hypothetical protein